MRLIFILILFFLLYQLLKRIFFPPPRKTFQFTPRSNRIIEDEMVKDPCCNTYLPKKEAYQMENRGEIHYFCSEECLNKFQEDLQK